MLMFQTHAYDAWTREPDRNGFFWNLARMQLGGFPARMFLFLAGVSLMLRYSADARRGVSELQARYGAAKRGAEVLVYGLAFRLAEWLFGGASAEATRHLFKVDILNCIGVSLMLCSLLVGPVHLKPRRPPLLALLLIPLFVLFTPRLQALAYPSWLPAPLGGYLWDANPMGSFPLFPWLAYALSGAVVGAYWMRYAQEGRLEKLMCWTAILGGALAIAGQLGTYLGFYIYYPTPAVPVPAYPASYLYRTGMCMLCGALSYWWCLRASLTRFSALRTLGQASLLVYFVHIEIVYGFISWRIHHRLRLEWASVLIVILTALMIALAYVRIEHFGKKARKAPSSSGPAAIQ